MNSANLHAVPSTPAADDALKALAESLLLLSKAQDTLARVALILAEKSRGSK